MQREMRFPTVVGLLPTRTFALIASLILGSALPCAAEGTAHMAGEIYNVGAGARALGMASAHTAVVNDVTSLYYNPSGLATLPGRQVTLLQAALYEGAAYQYLGYAQNMKKRPGGWGLEMLRLGASGGKGRDLNNQATGDFGYNETSLGFGAGVRGVVLPDMSLGIKVKQLSRSLGGSSDKMMSIDVGGQYGPLLNERLNLGFTAQNMFTRVQGDTEDKLPMIIRMGAAYKLIGGFLVSADISSAKEFRFGTEYSLGGWAHLRAGYAPEGMTFGTGFIFRQAYALDIAMVNHPTLGLSQRLSLGYKFKGSQGKKMEAFAQEFMNNAMLELQKRNYVKASKDLDRALAVNPRIGDQGWASKAKRLRALIEGMELAQHVDMQESMRQNTAQAALAQQAIGAYLEHDDGRAMLFAHAAHGQDTRDQAYARLLNTLSKETRQDIKREDILPPVTLANRKLRDAVDAVYAGKYDVGVRACKEALILDPNSATAWMRLGSAYFAAGDKGNALQAYRNALQLDPSNEKLRQFMAQQGMPLQ